MAVRYTPEYSAEIRRRIYNFNQTRRRAEESGVPQSRLPRPVKVSEFKKIYKNKRDLERALNHLDKFSRKSTRDIIHLDDIIMTRWDYEYFKLNRKLAEQYFQNEYDRVEARTSIYPGERDYINTISAKLNVLKNDINELNGREILAGLRAVQEFVASPSLRKTQYRNYMRAVEEVMDTVGIDEASKKAFFKKLEQLTPTQFLYLNDHNPIISRVCELYFDKNDYGEVMLNIDVDSAENIIENLLEDIDLMIEEAKRNSV